MKRGKIWKKLIFFVSIKSIEKKNELKETEYLIFYKCEKVLQPGSTSGTLNYHLSDVSKFKFFAAKKSFSSLK